MKTITDEAIKIWEKQYSGQLNKYMQYNYPIFVSKIDDEYEALIEDLPGCVGYGETEEAALKDLETNKRIWFLITFKNGVRPPTPKEAREVLKVLVRLPRELHMKAARTAGRMGMSFNTFVIESLRQAIGTPNYQVSQKEIEYERQNTWEPEYNLAAAA